MESSEDELQLLSNNIVEAANINGANLIPEISKQKYKQSAYYSFIN